MVLRYYNESVDAHQQQKTSPEARLTRSLNYVAVLKSTHYFARQQTRGTVIDMQAVTEFYAEHLDTINSDYSQQIMTMIASTSEQYQPMTPISPLAMLSANCQPSRTTGTTREDDELVISNTNPVTA